VRTIDYNAFMNEKKEKYFSLRARLGNKGLPRRRKRDPREREILLRMDKARWEKWLSEKKLVKLGPRSWLLVVD